MAKRISVTQESNSGRNQRFHDNYTGADMTRTQLVNKIENGVYDNYHVRIINNIPTPCFNPDKSINNNLG